MNRIHYTARIDNRILAMLRARSEFSGVPEGAIVERALLMMGIC